MRLKGTDTMAGIIREDTIPTEVHHQALGEHALVVVEPVNAKHVTGKDGTTMKPDIIPETRTKQEQIVRFAEGPGIAGLAMEQAT